MKKDKSIFIKNIYYMLSYAFTTLKQDRFEEIATESFENIHNLFAAILAKGIGRQLKQGLYREYINHIEDTTVVRGKINMPGTVRSRIANKRAVTCEYDELSENNLLNQILKTTVVLLLKQGSVDEEHKVNLKKEMLFFSNVDTVEPNEIRWSSIRFQRNNNTYRMLISLCQLVLEGMLLTTDDGEYRLATFVDEQRMCRLYEKFILEYYVREYPQIKASASQIPWALDDGVGTMLPVMQSDIMLTKDGTVLIIDAKYYSHTTQSQYNTHTVHSHRFNGGKIWQTQKEQEREELHKAIWGIADDLRGSVDGWDFKQYVLGMMFYRYISENLANYINKGEREAGDLAFDYAQLSDGEAEGAREDLVQEKGFFILPSELFVNVRARAKDDENLNETLERVFNNIENSAKGSESEDDFSGLFDDLDVNSNKLGATVAKRNDKLVKLLNGVGEMKLGNYQDNTIDAFGDAYEFLMSMYASNAGKSGGEFFTPQEVSELLTRLAVVGKT